MHLIYVWKSNLRLNWELEIWNWIKWRKENKKKKRNSPTLGRIFPLAHHHAHSAQLHICVDRWGPLGASAHTEAVTGGAPLPPQPFFFMGGPPSCPSSWPWIPAATKLRNNLRVLRPIVGSLRSVYTAPQHALFTERRQRERDRGERFYRHRDRAWLRHSPRVGVQGRRWALGCVGSLDRKGEHQILGFPHRNSSAAAEQRRGMGSFTAASISGK